MLNGKNGNDGLSGDGGGVACSGGDDDPALLVRTDPEAGNCTIANAAITMIASVTASDMLTGKRSDGAIGSGFGKVAYVAGLSLAPGSRSSSRYMVGNTQLRRFDVRGGASLPDAGQSRSVGAICGAPRKAGWGT